MRDIKFCGKRIDNGEWVIGSLIKCGITGKAYIFPIDCDANESDKVGEEGCLRLVAFEVIPETVGQYTGLCDKNGKEIYEGDILDISHDDGAMYGAVKYDEEYARYWIEEGGDSYPPDEFDFEQVVNIGNIHDNKDLPCEQA